MNDTDELVQLPDPAVQPLVHPLDLPEARGTFRRAWVVSTLSDPAVALCVAALVWAASRNVLAPVLAGVSLIGFGALAGRFFDGEAWAYIPRRRQDRGRPLPAAWDLTSSVLFGVLLAAGLLATVGRLAQGDIPVDVRRFTLGMAVAAAAVIVADFVVKVGTRRGAARRRAWSSLPGVIAVVGSVLAAVLVWFDGLAQGWSALTSAGAATMLAIGAAAGAWRHLDARRVASGSTSST